MKSTMPRLPASVTGSHPARGAWIEMPMLVTRAEADVSHPARGAWIEIVWADPTAGAFYVAPRKGCVD